MLVALSARMGRGFSARRSKENLRSKFAIAFEAEVEKSNEITAIAALIERLHLDGGLVSMALPVGPEGQPADAPCCEIAGAKPHHPGEPQRRDFPGRIAAASGTENWR
jgi:hypothetical protein